MLLRNISIEFQLNFIVFESVIIYIETKNKEHDNSGI